MDFSKHGREADRPKPSSRVGRRTSVGAAFSAVVGWSAGRSLPSPLRPLAYRAFARAVGANLDEAELALGAYPSLGEFFARRLRDGARTIDVSRDALIAPCDGVIAARGTAVAGALVQAKGQDYQLAELLADDALAARLTGGAYVTIYLSPRDYHRVHAPVAARLVAYHYVPGALWPVNPRLAGRRDRLLARNERVVLELRSSEDQDGKERAKPDLRSSEDQDGAIAMVMVGAAGVGNIRVAHGFDSATLRRTRERRRVELAQVDVARGDELGAFRLGSTVVLVFEPGLATLAGEVGQAVQFGERLGVLHRRAP